MAHFAELDSNNVVKRVVVVGNDVETAAGPLGENDMHVDGETWCVNFFKGGNWKQTSYNHNFRKRYCGKGDTFDSAKNKFISPQPFTSWSLDENDDWRAPVTYPTDPGTEGNPKFISWDEAGLKWTATDNSDPVNNFNWDASGLTWVSA
jgi:hypothetical protein